MSNLLNRTLPQSESAVFERLPPSVRTFLIESERRIVEHCIRLLALPDLTLEHRQRLSRLVGLVEAQSQGLVTGRRAVSS
jgi:hypothetical protein